MKLRETFKHANIVWEVVDDEDGDNNDDNDKQVVLDVPRVSKPVAAEGPYAAGDTKPKPPLVFNLADDDAKDVLLEDLSWAYGQSHWRRVLNTR